MTPERLAAYFARIGYAGERSPTHAVLDGLIARHLRAIPFEGLDPFLGRGVDIAPEAIYTKLVGARRGGYCFEQNGLFCDVLTALGFRTRPLGARVVWMLPPDAAPTPRTHRLTEVQIDHEVYLADVGFGGQSPAAALRLVVGEPQATSHGVYRIISRDEAYELQMETAQGFAGMYLFTREPQVQADYEMGNWYTATYPHGRFTQNLIAAIIGAEGRYTLLNRQFALRRPDGTTDERALCDAAALHRALTETFRIDPPADAQTIWNRLPKVS